MKASYSAHVREWIGDVLIAHTASLRKLTEYLELARDLYATLVSMIGDCGVHDLQNGRGCVQGNQFFSFFPGSIGRDIDFYCASSACIVVGGEVQTGRWR